MAVCGRKSPVATGRHRPISDIQVEVFVCQAGAKQCLEKQRRFSNPQKNCYNDHKHGGEIMKLSFNGRPAWRNEWLLITLMTILSLFLALGIFAMFTVDGAGPASIMPLLIIWFGGMCTLLYRHYSWIYNISGEQIESRHGIIARDMKTVRLQDLRNVNVKQSFFQRIFGIGDLEFSSAGGSGVEVAFYGILKPMDLQKDVQLARG
jgi:membrane protein YdbS with pleckstrin-like domain